MLSRWTAPRRPSASSSRTSTRSLADLRGRLFPFSFATAARACPQAALQDRVGSRCSGCARQYQRSAAGGAIILACIDELRRLNRVHNLEQVEFGWVLEDNIGMRRPIEMVGREGGQGPPRLRKATRHGGAPAQTAGGGERQTAQLWREDWFDECSDEHIGCDLCRSFACGAAARNPESAPADPGADRP